MKTKISLLLAVFFTIFTLPVNGLTTLADENEYDNIEDGTYDIIAESIHATKDEPSGASAFVNEDADLIIKDGKIELTIGIPKVDGVVVEGMQIEDQEPEVEEKNDVEYFTYELESLKTVLNSQVQYVVDIPDANFDHDVPYRLFLKGLDELPVKAENTEIDDSSNNDEETTKDASEEEADNLSTDKDTPIGLYVSLFIGLIIIILFVVYRYRSARK